MAKAAPDFVAIGIDSGRESGWAVAADAKTILAAGVATTPADRIDAVEHAEALARERSLPIVTVLEKWGAGGWQTHSTIIGMGEQRGRWLEVLELYLQIEKKHIVQPHPNQWRTAFFEQKDWFGKKSPELKRLACTYTGVPDHNEAEARLLAMYAFVSEAGLDAADKAWRRLRRHHKSR